jgi:riboflavin-specific deaminase-like protein
MLLCLLSSKKGINVKMPIDESTAWNLIQAISADFKTPDPSTRVHHTAKPDIWLEVYPAGNWKASCLVTDEAHELFDLYVPLQLQTDLIIGQIGQSLDGRIATENGQSHYVTGPEDIKRLHRLRALVDAVIVGAGTIASDNPRLTVREIEGNNPARVVLDPNNRLDINSHVFSDGAAPTLIIQKDSNIQSRNATNVEAITLPTVTNENNFDVFDPRTVLMALKNLGLRRVLIEGGGITLSHFLQAGTLNRLHITVAPILIGSGRSAVILKPIQSLEKAIRPPCRYFHLGKDILFDLDLR